MAALLLRNLNFLPNIKINPTSPNRIRIRSVKLLSKMVPPSRKIRRHRKSSSHLDLGWRRRIRMGWGQHSKAGNVQLSIPTSRARTVTTNRPTTRPRVSSLRSNLSKAPRNPKAPRARMWQKVESCHMWARYGTYRQRLQRKARLAWLRSWARSRQSPRSLLSHQSSCKIN